MKTLSKNLHDMFILLFFAFGFFMGILSHVIKCITKKLFGVFDVYIETITKSTWSGFKTGWKIIKVNTF